MFKKLIGAICISSCLFYGLKAEATDVRVALVQGQKNVALKAEHAFKVLDLGTGTEQNFPKGKYFARIQDGHIYLEKTELGQAIQFISVDDKELPSVNGRNYDGLLKIQIDGENLLATNTLELEKLLCRVLPSKTMPIWPDEAIKAQAVAARSYILHQKAQMAGKKYDLKALDEETPYIGLGQRVEKSAISKLIKETEGQFVADYYGRPIYALTTSSSGGKTESAKEALGVDYSYLESVKDFDEDSPEHKWDFRISPDYVTELLAQHGFIVGKLANVRLSPANEPGGDRTESGRVKYLILGGSLGTAKLSGQHFAELFNLNSNNFDVTAGTPAPEKIEVPIENRYGMEIGRKEIPIKVKEKEPKIWSEYMQSYHVLTGGKDEKLIFRGKGKGKGIGLSAWGARAMASGEEPKSYKEILMHYYPGTHLVK